MSNALTYAFAHEGIKRWSGLTSRSEEPERVCKKLTTTLTLGKPTARTAPPTARMRAPTAFVRGVLVKPKPPESEEQWWKSGPIPKDKWFCVWCEAAERPRRRHGDRERAAREARQLAAKAPGRRFMVLEVSVVGSVQAAPKSQSEMI